MHLAYIYDIVNEKLKIMFKNYFVLLFSSLLLIGFSSCDNEPDDDDINQQEVITTMTLTLTPADGVPVVLSFLDEDGDQEGIITGGTLESNTTYTGTIQLLNETTTPPEDVTEEVRIKDDEHQLFFQSTIDGLSVDYNDADDNGNPLGISTTITTGAAGSGTLIVTLLHEPLKELASVMNGDISEAGGETDIEVPFEIEIQ